jgi:hypothetical protein
MKVQHYKTADLELLFSPMAFLPETEKGPMSPKEADIDELLFYSAPQRE